MRINRIVVWVWQRLKLIRETGGNWKDNQAKFALLCWEIWKDCNSFYFEQASLNPTTVISHAVEKAMEFFDCNPLVPPSYAIQASNYHPSFFARLGVGSGMFRCNIIAAFQESSSSCSTDFLLRDDHRVLLTSSTRRFWCHSPLVAEALALREGVIEPIIADIKRLMVENSTYVVHWIPRSMNSPADWVARAASSRSLPTLWPSCPPEGLNRLLLADF
ncbi:uncharacterized protein G2W53_018037 [Senna tora]|uniref:RNase H type-1 domain-containing protein n=1 Tax=Senna tora TaxID=362788 RepID=A0A834TQK2_9FABA|nr:uncharacterized protein G2W53_018037 [Senna tora]